MTSYSPQCTRIPNVVLNYSKGSMCANAVLKYPHCLDGHDYCIQADSDFVGVGVLVAFVVTAAFALITAYLSLGVQLMDYIETQELADLEQVKKSVSVRRLFLQILKYLHLIITCLPQRPRSQGPGSTSHHQREHLQKFCEDFLLTLSDQQLVTGLAILIAGWLNHKSLTVYESEMASNLAWMSSDVHLLTVGQLRGFFEKNPHAKYWRSIGMISTFILLFVANFYRGHFEWFSKFHHPIQCILDDINRSPANIHGRAAVNMSIWAVFLMYSYGAGILPLYFNTKSRRDRLLARRAILEDKNNKSSRFKLFLLDIFWVISSEAFNVLVIQTFWFSYGSWSIWIDRKHALGYGVVGGGNVPWDLGQIVPLFLLALPILNAFDFFVWLSPENVLQEGPLS